MAVKLEELVFELKAESSSLRKDMKKVEATVSKSTKNASKNLKKMSKTTSALGASFKLLAPLISIVMIAGLGKLASAALDAADDLGKTADKLGISTTKLQEYRFAADLAGISTQEFDMSMQRFARRVGDAARGIGPLKDALIAMNINVRDNRGELKSTTDLFDEYANGLANITDHQLKMSLATAGFDVAGAKMLNMLKNGSQGLREVAEEAKKYGLILSEETIRNAEAAKDELTKVNTALKIQKDTLALELIPMVILFNTAMLNMAKGASHLARTLGMIPETMDSLKRKGRELVDQYQAMTPVMAAFLGKTFDQAREDIFKQKDLIDDQIIVMEKAAAAQEQMRKKLAGQGTEGPQIISKQQQLEAEKERELLTSRLEGIREFVMTDAQLTDSRHSKRLESLKTARGLELITEEELNNLSLELQTQHDQREIDMREAKNNALLSAEERHVRGLNDLWNAGNKGKLRVAQTGMKALSRVLLSGSKKQFELGKKVAIADSLVSTYQGVAASWKLGWPMGAIAASITLANGLAAVRNIKSQSFSGGGGISGGVGGGGGSGTFQQRAPLGPVAPEITQLNQQRGLTTIVIQGNITTKEWTENELIPMIRDAVSNQDVVIIEPGSRQAQEIVDSI